MLPLEGLLVVSIEQAVAAPQCTLRLADAGARVIKIERAEGETARHYDSAVKGTSAYFAWLNRGKESIVLDIKNEDDRGLVERMVARADVFVQNLAPGAAARLGLGSTDLVKRYPGLTAVDIVGYGQDTDYRNMRAYDLLIQAETGLCTVTGTPEEPVKVGVSIADVVTGMNAYMAVLEALIGRTKSGRGKALEIAMFDAVADLMSVPLLHHDYARWETPRTGLAHASIYPYGRVECLDGDIIIVVQNPDEWQRFCLGVLRRPEIISDTRYASNSLRVANREALAGIIRDAFGRLTRSEAITRLEANGLAWSRVSTVADLSAHPALRRIPVETPGGEIRMVRSPVRQKIKIGAVPELGAQTEIVRREFAR
ncbi:carnitine dehydratase [Methylovirgula ligni]|uniref:Crotonobetainyl-CoA:carnitine CoA-transferase CaiB-like acyl-CoA transferase n=1 Tax=Methylovirgula ligni TaxID=569860 RepID=A0A3D9Z1X0_9HYPH|nr:CaiB/BaiF CoA-transferase family protein [Methylovirgula ligni]QAY95501.1 carnitine dehydratase [Methylovirgula ligni]REF89162.1 crotonobetainyl-CoA:carnitine CoA-transferase CaiB-like acyl-CoA transferase [Methylovirgula ligni]